MPIPDLLTTDQTAALAGVSRPTVIKAIEDKRLAAFRIGQQRGWTIRRADAVAYRDAVATARKDAEVDRNKRAREVVSTKS